MCLPNGKALLLINHQKLNYLAPVLEEKSSTGQA